MNEISPINTGILTNDAMPGHPHAPTVRQTIVATGLARSGTSMLAALLRTAGVYMGEHLHDGTGEDAEILNLLVGGRIGEFQEMVDRRNADHAMWGFKLPDLHLLLPADQFHRLRNPRLIVVTRDPVAVAVRHTLSEHYDVATPVATAAYAQIGVLHYVDSLDCPKLFLSYEKAITFPDETIANVLAFCGLAPSRTTRRLMRKCIEPNNETYRTLTQRSFQGCLDGLIGTVLVGWCRDIHSRAPLEVEVFADDASLGVFRAADLRPDLRDGKIGSGHHGFHVDLSRRGLGPDAIIRARVHGRRYILPNSGVRLADLALAAGSSA